MGWEVKLEYSKEKDQKFIIYCGFLFTIFLVIFHFKLYK